MIGKRLLALNYEDLFVVEGQAKADVRNEMILEMIYNVDGTNVHRNWTGFGFVSLYARTNVSTSEYAVGRILMNV